MPSLKFQLRISFLFYVGFCHNLVKEIWVVHMTLRSYKISCEIEGHVDLWSQLQGKCIFLLYRLICQFITQSIIDRITPNFKVWSLKAKEKYRGMLRHQYFSMEIYHVLSDWAQICLRKIRLRICIYILTCDIINLVFNKKEETFQSNTLDWSSLVFFIILSYFYLPPHASLDCSIISHPISMKFGMYIVHDETNRCLKFQVNRTRGRDRAWSQTFTMLYNRKNSIYCA